MFLPPLSYSSVLLIYESCNVKGTLYISLKCRARTLTRCTLNNRCYVCKWCSRNSREELGNLLYYTLLLSGRFIMKMRSIISEFLITSRRKWSGKRRYTSRQHPFCAQRRESAPFLEARRSRKGFNEQLRERERAPARRAASRRPVALIPGIIPRGAAPRPRNYWS